MSRTKPTVAFLCVHNSCRSQMAESLGKVLDLKERVARDALS